MLNLESLIIYILEGVAISICIMLVTKKSLKIDELLLICSSIVMTFIILDIFSPSMGSYARQGTGFALGVNQMGNGGATSLPRKWYGTGNAEDNQMIENMDSEIAKQYYAKWNPGESTNEVNAEYPYESNTKINENAQINENELNSKAPAGITDKLKSVRYQALI